MRHRGTHARNFYVGDREGREGLDEEDEEVLVLFASQAAGRSRMRARAWKALVETSPVGVVVFDAWIDALASINRQARCEDANVKAVRNFVKKIRRKPGDDPASPSFITNVRGVGYRMPNPGEA